MNISVFGTGYVGCTLIGCLAIKGFKTICFDINKEKIEMLNKGISPILENEVIDVIAKGKENIIGVIDPKEAILKTDISFICVGTPSNSDGSVFLQYIYDVAKTIGESLKKKESYHLIVIRSTVPPGTTQKVIDIIEKESGKKIGEFGCSMNPEFLREGSSVEDFFNPPYTIIGSDDKKSSEALEDFYQEIGIKEDIYHVDLKTSELFKYANNVFHATKVAFGNEIGRIARHFDIDSHNLMKIFCKDTKLNLSPYYLRPGFAFGGSCLPKDVKALNAISKEQGINVPLLDSLIKSNDEHINAALEKIILMNPKKVLLLGITFKPNTDDLRESPYLYLLHKLTKKGIKVNYYDPNVDIDSLIGANKDFAEQILELDKVQLKDFDLIKEYDLFVIGSFNDEIKIQKLIGKNILDLRGNKKKIDGYETIV